MFTSVFVKMSGIVVGDTSEVAAQSFTNNHHPLFPESGHSHLLFPVTLFPNKTLSVICQVVLNK